MSGASAFALALTYVRTFLSVTHTHALRPAFQHWFPSEPARLPCLKLQPPRTPVLLFLSFYHYCYLLVQVLVCLPQGVRSMKAGCGTALFSVVYSAPGSIGQMAGPPELLAGERNLPKPIHHLP